MDLSYSARLSDDSVNREEWSGVHFQTFDYTICMNAMVSSGRSRGVSPGPFVAELPDFYEVVNGQVVELKNTSVKSIACAYD